MKIIFFTINILFFINFIYSKDVSYITVVEQPEKHIKTYAKEALSLCSTIIKSEISMHSEFKVIPSKDSREYELYFGELEKYGDTGPLPFYELQSNTQYPNEFIVIYETELNVENNFSVIISWQEGRNVNKRFVAIPIKYGIPSDQVSSIIQTYIHNMIMSVLLEPNKEKIRIATFFLPGYGQFMMQNQIQGSIFSILGGTSIVGLSIFSISYFTNIAKSSDSTSPYYREYYIKMSERDLGWMLLSCSSYLVTGFLSTVVFNFQM